MQRLQSHSRGSATLTQAHAAWSHAMGLSTSCEQAAADPKFAHTLRRQRLGQRSSGGGGGGGINSGSSTPAYDTAAAQQAVGRAATAMRLSPDQRLRTPGESGSCSIRGAKHHEQDSLAGLNVSHAALQALVVPSGAAERLFLMLSQRSWSGSNI